MFPLALISPSVFIDTPKELPKPSCNTLNDVDAVLLVPT
jgi:hypothetical protein